MVSYDLSKVLTLSSIPVVAPFALASNGDESHCQAICIFHRKCQLNNEQYRIIDQCLLRPVS